MEQSKKKVAMRSCHPNVKKTVETIKTIPEKVRHVSKLVHKSQPRQPISNKAIKTNPQMVYHKSQPRLPFSNKAMITEETKMTNPDMVRHIPKSVHKSLSREVITKRATIQPLVEKFDREILEASKNATAGKIRGSKANMKNLGKRFITLVKKNANENAKKLHEDQDLNLIKNQVSVRQIKQIFAQNINGERKSFHRTSYNSYRSRNRSNPILDELLETVRMKRSSSKLVESLMRDCDTKALPKFEEANETDTGTKSMSMLPITQTTFTTFHIQTTDTHGNPDDQDWMGDDLFNAKKTNSDVFQPQSYAFRLSSNTPMTECPISAKPPPFWALLDNFIAVIWGILHHEGLGINQLHWTYELLKVMKYKSGQVPEIIEEYIDIIQEKLILAYAEFYELKEKGKEESNEDVADGTKGKLDGIARRTARKNKWVDRNALLKSFSLREIVRQGINSIRKPTEADKLIIKSLIPTAAKEHQAKAAKDDKGEENDDERQVDDAETLEKVKNLLCKMRKEKAEEIQKNMSKYHKIESLMVHVDCTFKPTIDYEAAQIVAANMSKMDENKKTAKKH